MDLNSVFKQGYMSDIYIAYEMEIANAQFEFIKMNLWVGRDSCGDLSYPNKKDLSLNNYETVSFEINNLYHRRLELQDMHNLFGLDLLCYPPDNSPSSQPACGRCVPMEMLIRILEKLGFYSFPPDAGDGE